MFITLDPAPENLPNLDPDPGPNLNPDPSLFSEFSHRNIIGIDFEKCFKLPVLFCNFSLKNN